MKKILAFSLLAAAASFSGCTKVTVDIPGSKFAGEAVWTRRTLENVRYYNSDVEAVKAATIATCRELDLYYAGDTPSKYGTELFFCGPKFVKITIDITHRAPKAPKGSDLPPPQPYTELAIVYGTWGDLNASQAIISGISKRLPSEG